MLRPILFLSLSLSGTAFMSPKSALIPSHIGIGASKCTTSAAPSSSSSSLHAVSICNFDSSDFALPTGEWPYTAADLNRLDNSSDDVFYTEPRFVTHIDDRAIELLTDYYKQEMTTLQQGKDKLDVLDLCSSWISHLPTEGVKYGNVVGVGMNEKELLANKQLTDYIVQDLNQQPSLSHLEDNSFDVICNVVSVDYLTKPLEVFKEMHRVLRPGGISLMSFSNRCFPTKAVAMWLQADDIGRLTIVASYYHYSSEWKSIEALDLKEMQSVPARPGTAELFQNPSLGLAWMNAAAAVQKNNGGDPMFVVKGVK
jgi:ubiquinone/menaquinone biosynthesis C-methylase UbiE